MKKALFCSILFIHSVFASDCSFVKYERDKFHRRSETTLMVTTAAGVATSAGLFQLIKPRTPSFLDYDSGNPQHLLRDWHIMWKVHHLRRLDAAYRATRFVGPKAFALGALVVGGHFINYRRNVHDYLGKQTPPTPEEPEVSRR